MRLGRWDFLPFDCIYGVFTVNLYIFAMNNIACSGINFDRPCQDYDIRVHVDLL